MCYVHERSGSTKFNTIKEALKYVKSKKLNSETFIQIEFKGSKTEFITELERDNINLEDLSC